MKTIKIYAILLTAAWIGFACNPIEDQSLREKYFKNAGNPITQSELDAAISVTQPFPNVDGKIEGDQYVVIKNNRPDIGGTWHLGWSTGEKIVGTDQDTIIYDSNGNFDIYYVGISENQVVQSKKINISVTNVFDQYMNFLSGAENKADNTAKKTWTFAAASDIVYEGAHGAWKYLPITPGFGKWWQDNIPTDIREQTMVFEFANNKFATYKNDGSLIATGKWGYTHETPEEIQGELITTVPVIGSAYDAYSKRGDDKYWILKINEKELVIYHPQLYVGGEDWDNDGYYFFFRAKE